MQIKNAEFITSIAKPEKYLEVSLTYNCPEICVVGRSNVGKSSFINMITKRRKLAKTSSTPGRTRLINLFNINDGVFYLVDLPGYGYAKASKDNKKEWDALIGGYIETSKKLKHVLVLVDSRHEPSKLDVLMVEYLYFYRLPFTVIATKSDKLSKAELGRNIQKIAATLKIGRDNIIPISSETGNGRDDVSRRFGEILEDSDIEKF